MAVVRVLVVDDEAAFLRAMTSVARETVGFEVVGEASSGEESVVVAAEVGPDLVPIDVASVACRGPRDRLSMPLRGSSVLWWKCSVGQRVSPTLQSCR